MKAMRETMQQRHYLFLGAVLALTAMLACEGSTGPEGAPGSALQVQVTTGTILNPNFTERNPSSASIPLAAGGPEPTVLFFGIENPNGVYERYIDPFGDSIIWGESEGFTVPGTSGWYMLVSDENKDLVNSNYQVKFIQ
jgi:hypothetical protein